MNEQEPHEKWLRLVAERLHKQQRDYSIANTCEQAADAMEALADENERLRAAVEIIRPHVDLGQARLNGSYCAAKIDEHTFCGRGREWPGHRSDAKEWPEHKFIDGGALVSAVESLPHHQS